MGWYWETYFMYLASGLICTFLVPLFLIKCLFSTQAYLRQSSDEQFLYEKKRRHKQIEKDLREYWRKSKK